MPDLSEITVAIPAYNAAETIERALSSALGAGAQKLLLVDSGSNDDTLKIAQQAGGTGLEVISLPSTKGIGVARQTLLEQIETEYGLWLDADDAFLPTRMKAMAAAFKTGADLVYDAGILMDHASGKELRELPIPAFLMERDGLARQLERNWLPIMTCGFKTETARGIGFDPAFTSGEDYDFNLRALESGANISLLPEVHYQYFHLQNSASRQLKATTNHFWTAKKKISSGWFKTMLDQSAIKTETKAFVHACHLLSLGDYYAATEQALRLVGSSADIPPYQACADTLGGYVAGTARLLAGEPRRALALFSAASEQTPELLNNLGAAYRLTGDPEKANECFTSALTLMPGFHDAAMNLNSGKQTPPSITRLPLRGAPSRSEYL